MFIVENLWSCLAYCHKACAVMDAISTMRQTHKTLYWTDELNTINQDFIFFIISYFYFSY